jgi:sulfate transport system permease protein
MSTVNRSVLPGFRLSLGLTMFYLSIMVLIPLAACFSKAATLTFKEFYEAVWTPRARAAYALTLGAAGAASAINVVIGLLLAWVLVRYSFPFKKLLDAIIDLPFALPTAVAGLVYSSLYAPMGGLGNGWCLWA